MAEKIIPFEQNDRAQRLFERLKRGPGTTPELQKELGLVHVPRQIWELRTWYGWQIKTGRLSNGVARYTLDGRAEVDPPKSPTCPKCDALLRDVRQTLVDEWIEGRCTKHGRFTLKLP